MPNITMHSDRLKSCPFCSSPGIYETCNHDEGGYYNLGCAAARCPAHQIYFAERLLPLESAIREWNTRTDTSKDKLVDALKTAKMLIECEASFEDKERYRQEFNQIEAALKEAE